MMMMTDINDSSKNDSSTDAVLHTDETLKNLYNYKSYLFNTATTPSVDIATNIMQLIIKSNIKLEHSTLHTKLYSLKKAIRAFPPMDISNQYMN